VKFLVDHQLPPALAQYLREHGFDSEHVIEAGLSTATDIDICRYAKLKGAPLSAKMRIFSISPEPLKREYGSFGFGSETAGQPFCWRLSIASGRSSNPA
jgi:hypothetical protein